MTPHDLQDKTVNAVLCRDVSHASAGRVVKITLASGYAVTSSSANSQPGLAAMAYQLVFNIPLILEKRLTL